MLPSRELIKIEVWSTESFWAYESAEHRPVNDVSVRQITTPRCHKNGIPGCKPQFGVWSRLESSRRKKQDQDQDLAWELTQDQDQVRACLYASRRGSKFCWLPLRADSRPKFWWLITSSWPSLRSCSRYKFWWLLQVLGLPFVPVDLKGTKINRMLPKFSSMSRLWFQSFLLI